MDFLILGPLEVRSSGRSLDLGGAKQRAVLAVLLLRAGKVVSTEGLADELWGTRPPASATKLVQGYVSGLRRLLGDAIRTRPPGYALEVELETIDAHRFERLAREGHPHDALALWRGPALGDILLEGTAAREAARLDDLRLVVTEARLDADLAAGRHAELVPELQLLVAEQPLRERLHAQLMLALYRSQRQAEALEAYRVARRTLVDELGLEPGRELHELEQAILRHDPSLEPLALPPRRRWRRRALAAACALIAVAAIAVAATVRGRGEPASVTLAGNAVAVIDPDSGKILDEIPIGGRPSAVAVGDGSVWAANEDDETLVRIDPRTRRVVRTIGLGVPPTDVAVGAGAAWVASELTGEVLRIDLASNEATARVSFASPGGVDFLNVLATRDAVWVVNTHARISRINPVTGAVARGIALHQLSEARRTPLVYADGVVWAGVEHRVLTVDASLAVLDELLATDLGAGIVGLAAGAGAMWATAYPRQALIRIDRRERRVVAVLPLGHLPWRLAFGAGSVWVATSDPVLLRVDPVTEAVSEIPLGVYTPQGSGEPVAVGYGAVWVAVRR